MRNHMPISSLADKTENAVFCRKVQRSTLEASQANKRDTSIGHPQQRADDMIRYSAKAESNGLNACYTTTREKFIFPIIRAVFANLVASELVTTQALTAPTGTIFN